MDAVSLASIAISVLSIAISIDTIRLTRKRRNRD